MQELINEVKKGESHIGWFQLGLSFEFDSEFIQTLKDCNKENIETLQLEYCSFYKGAFEKMLENLNGAKNVSRMYFTHNHVLPSEDIEKFVMKNDCYLKHLDLDTTSVSPEPIANLIRAGRIENLNIGSSRGIYEGNLEILCQAQQGKKCIINTERLLPLLYRYRGCFVPKTPEEVAKREKSEKIVEQIRNNNNFAIRMGASPDDRRSSKRKDSNECKNVKDGDAN